MFFENVQFLNESSKDVIFSVQDLIDEGYSEKDAIYKFKYIIIAFERESLINRKKIPNPVTKESVLTKGCCKLGFGHLVKRIINSVIDARTPQDIDYIIHSASITATQRY